MMDTYSFRVGTAIVYVEHGYIAGGRNPTIRIVSDGKEKTLIVENPLGMIETMRIELKKP